MFAFVSTSSLLAMEDSETWPKTMPTKLTLEILETIDKNGFLHTINGEYKPRHKEMVSSLLKLFHNSERLNKIKSNKVFQRDGKLIFSLRQFHNNQILAHPNGPESKEEEEIILPRFIVYDFVLIKKK